MANKRIEQLKPLTLLLGFLALWWLIPTGFKSFVDSSFYEFQAPFYATASHSQDLQEYWGLKNHSKNELIEAGRDIARQRAFYSLNVQQLNALNQEIERLEKLLDLPSVPEYRYEVARVAKRDLSAWWQQIIIRKGKNYDIPIGAAVVYGGGVVGRIREVKAYQSIVELVSSPGFRMAANIEGELHPVTYQGLLNPPFSPPQGQVLNIPPEIRIDSTQSKKLVSSRLGGIFPEGLTVGTIINLEPGPDGFFQKGQVELDFELNALREVAIIIPIKAEMTQP